MKYQANRKEIIFLTVYAIYLAALLLDISVLYENHAVSTTVSFVRYACYAAEILIILWEGFYGRQYWMLILAAGVVALAVMGSGNKTFLFYFLCIIAAKDVNLRRIIKVSLCLQGAFLAFSVMCSQMGIITDYLFDPNTRVRHGLGFTFATPAPMLLFFCIMEYLYLRREKLHFAEVVVLEALSYYLYVLTNSRMLFAMSAAALIYVYIMKFYWQNHQERIRKNRILVLVPIVCCLSGVGMALLYNDQSDTWKKLNSFLSDRLNLGHTAWSTYGLSLFGQPIEWVGYGKTQSAVGAYNYVDCSYLQILLEHGLLMLLLVVALYTYIMYKAIRTKDFYLQTAILFIAVMSITEPRLMHLAYNPFPLLAMGYFAVGQKDRVYQRRPDAVRPFRFASPHVGLKRRV